MKLKMPFLSELPNPTKLSSSSVEGIGCCVRVLIISLLLMINFTNAPNFWEANGYIVLGALILILSSLPFIGWLVVIGCGYLTFNYLHNIHNWNIIISIIFGISISVIMGAFLSSRIKVKNTSFNTYN